MRATLAATFTLCLCLLLCAAARAQEQKPEIVVQTGHSGAVVSVAFSPGGKLFASGSSDQTVRLWDVRTGRLLRVLAGHGGAVSSIEFTPDGTRLVSKSDSSKVSHAEGGGDDVVRVWDVETGSLVFDIASGKHSEIASTALSSDGKILASWFTSIAEGEEQADGSVTLWDMRGGQRLRKLEGHAGAVSSAAFSPDGRMFVAGGDDKTVKVWDAQTGRLLFDLSEASPVASVAFSPDGSLIASQTSSGFGLWDAAGGKLVRRTPGRFVSFSPDARLVASWSPDLGSVNVAEARGGALAHTLGVARMKDDPTENEFERVAFAPDGRTLVISGIFGGKNRLSLWDARGWNLIAAREDYALASYGPDGKTLAAALLGENGASLEIWDAATGRQLHRNTKERVEWRGNSVAFSDDGRMIAALDGTLVNLFDAQTAELLHSYAGNGGWVMSVAFSPDGRRLAAGRPDGYDLWDARSGYLARTVAAEKNPGDESGPDAADFVAFGPDSKSMATGDGRLRDAQTGSPLRAFKASALAYAPDAKSYALAVEAGVEVRGAQTGALLRKFPLDGVVTALAYSPDGSKLLVGGSQGAVDLRLLDARTGRTLRRFEPGDIVTKVAYSPDGNFVAAVYGGGNSFCDINLYDARNGAAIDFGFIAAKKASGADEVTTYSQPGFVAFSPDGKLLALGSIDNTIELRETATGKLVRTLKGHTLNVWSVAFSADGKVLASASTDSTIKLWDTSTGEMLATLLSLAGGDWLVATPDGLFDGAPSAWDKILWRFSRSSFDVSPAEAFFNEFYHPGLLAEILAGERPRAAQSIADKDRRQPTLRVEAANGQPSPGGLSRARTISLKVEVSEAPQDTGHTRGSGARDVRLFRNGSLIRAWRGDVLQGKSSVTLDAADVSLVAGENRLVAYAFNSDDIKSANAELEVRGDDSLKRGGTLYVLAVGVNKYDNQSFDLRYASADAEAFAAELGRQQSALRRFRSVEVVKLFDEKATKENLLAALWRFAGEEATTAAGATAPELAGVKPAQPEDALVIYYAGHGTAHAGHFYLIPHDLGYAGSRDALDAAGLQAILSHAVSDEELEHALERVDAGQILMVIDACNSGQALEAEEKRRGPMNSKGLAQLAYEKGMYILTAAQSYQAALEAAQLGHGLLTYALVEEGLGKGAADDEPRDGQVTLREWLDYATWRVPQMQGEKMEEGSGRGVKLAFVEGEERVAESDKRNIQRPRAFYRRDPEPVPLIVAKGQSPPQRTERTPRPRRVVRQ